MRLADHTRVLLLNRPRTKTLLSISKDTGLTYNWLREYNLGRLETVCADKLQTLYEYLTGDKSRLDF